MTEPRISSLFKTRKRFLRSAHLERDFRDPGALEGYVITPEIQRRLNRLGSGLSPKSGQRAWRITGDYGSGKSSFALLLAHAFIYALCSSAVITSRLTGLPLTSPSTISGTSATVTRP
jgi:hypothetical protein